MHNLWVPDVKTVGAGENAQRFDYERFNAPLVAQYRGVLDDIAKETAGRQKNSWLDAWLREQLPKVDLSKLSRQQLDRLTNDEHLLTIICEPFFRAPD